MGRQGSEWIDAKYSHRLPHRTDNLYLIRASLHKDSLSFRLHTATSAGSIASAAGLIGGGGPIIIMALENRATCKGDIHCAMDDLKTGA